MHQDGLTHQVAREPAHDLYGVVLSRDLDVPGIRAARPRELGTCRLHTQDEHLHLDRPFYRPGLDGWRRMLAQIGCALAITCSRVTFMLCDSAACS